MSDWSEKLKYEAVPDEVKRVLEMLWAQGSEAFVVGGCVRDILMEKVPSDWDVCTSAKPEEIKRCFASEKLIETGLAHGTVTVLMGEMAVEVTTFRIDGAYRDGRHPESVEFTDTIEKDLARRDFTINAMAFHPCRGLIDPFEGEKAIAAKEIACVGAPDRRFAEDGLRIMRGLRFAATLGFAVERETLNAMKRCCGILKKVSRERINAELSKLLLGCYADRVFSEYGDILKEAVSGLVPARVNHLPELLPTRLAAVFPSETKRHLQNLKFSSKIVSDAQALARLGARKPPESEIQIKKMLASEGEEITWMYFAMFCEEAAAERVLKSGKCWNLKQLAVDGRDLLEIGIPPGREIGSLLEELLQLVIEEKLDNNRKALLDYSGRKVNP